MLFVHSSFSKYLVWFFSFCIGHSIVLFSWFRNIFGLITDLKLYHSYQSLSNSLITMFAKGAYLAFYSSVLDSLAVELKASKDFSKLYAGIAILWLHQ
ncbi:hypothetical protein ES332_A06G050800v1 [Gossypium tomentosum]|uniref:Uncharacterized protein n=2 Tax=Gossypium TaxID=3633 RepID=A0A5D2PZV1_GOSTO|nr:hypothetical protein ES332_A06G050800v1 [Gossypium tomentosum]